MSSTFLPSIRYIYFDFDNVLVRRSESRAVLVARMLDLPDAAALREFYFVEFHHNAALEARYLGLRNTEEEVSFYRDLFRLFANREHVAASADQLQAAAEAFVRVALVIQPGVTECLARLQGRYTLGIFSNGLPSRHQEITSSGLRPYFRDVVISCDYHAEKPSQGIYRIAIDKTGLQSSDIALVDDESANITAAEQAGFGQAVLFTPAFWRQVQ